MTASERVAEGSNVVATGQLVVVMPAYQASSHVEQTVGALRRFAPETPLVVVDPGSTDDTAARARALGATVIELGHRAGPAEARNAGVAAIEADVVLFIDSDCVVHEDTVERVRAAFAANPDLVSLTG